jgi:hypothetical protein
MSSRAVADSFDARLLRAMRSAIDGFAILDTMPDDGTLTVRTSRCHHVHRTFEVVERHGWRDPKSLVVVIAAYITSAH